MFNWVVESAPRSWFCGIFMCILIEGIWDIINIKCFIHIEKGLAPLYEWMDIYGLSP